MKDIDMNQYVYFDNKNLSWKMWISMCILIVKLGNGSSRGVVRVYNAESDDWEEVCSDDWNETLSGLVCRQLGYRYYYVINASLTVFSFVIIVYSLKVCLSTFLKRIYHCRPHETIFYLSHEKICFPVFWAKKAITCSFWMLHYIFLRHLLRQSTCICLQNYA